jgi:hypothetical protein
MFGSSSPFGASLSLHDLVGPELVHLSFGEAWRVFPV